MATRAGTVGQAPTTGCTFGYAGIQVGLPVDLTLMPECDFVRFRRSRVLKSVEIHGSSYCNARETPADWLQSIVQRL
jgi:hypothetical protein